MLRVISYYMFAVGFSIRTLLYAHDAPHLIPYLVGLIISIAAALLWLLYCAIYEQALEQLRAARTNRAGPSNSSRIPASEPMPAGHHVATRTGR